MMMSSSSTLFWKHFSSNSNNNKNEEKYLPPWLQDETLPFLNEDGIKQVATVLKAGVAFRKAINDVAEKKRAIKRNKEKEHKETLARIQQECETALKNRNRQDFVRAFNSFRQEVESFRETVAKLENSLSSSNNNNNNNNNHNSEQKDENSDEEQQDKKIIDDARQNFLKLCEETGKKWKSDFLNLENNNNDSSSSSPSSSSPTRPPWQLNFCAENDPFAKPSTEESKVTFDGGKILDRFGRDVWEDRCCVLGITIQAGATVGVGEERFRSVDHKNCVRSSLWQKWLDENRDFLIGENVVVVEASSLLSSDSSSSSSNNEIVDPFLNDLFIKCNNHRVMAFLDICEKIDDNNNNNSIITKNNKNNRLRVAVLESFREYQNFPLVGRLTSSSSSLSRSKDHFWTFSQVERMVCKFLDFLASSSSFLNNNHDSEKKNNNDSNGATGTSIKKLRCIAAVISDSPEWFILDLACAVAGICFVGLHSSWSQEDLNHAIENIVKPDLVIFDEDLKQTLSSSESSYTSSPCCGLLSFDELCQQGIFNADSEDDDDEKTTSPSTIESTLKKHQDVFADSLSNYHFDIFTNDDDKKEPQRPFTLMFSSGTGGRLKAVEVSAENWLQTTFKQQRYDLDPYSVVSFNALAHGLDRGLCWTAFFNAGRISFLPKQKKQGDSLIMKEKKQEILSQLLSSLVTRGTTNVLNDDRENNTSSMMNMMSLLPDFIVGSHICDPTVLVATPDQWSRIYKLFHENNNEIGGELQCVVEDAMSDRLKILQASMNKSENLFEVLLLQQQNQSSLPLPPSIRKVQQIIRTLFGRNIRQVATGGAPISPKVLTFFQNLFTFFIDVDSDVPKKLRIDERIKNNKDQNNNDNENATHQKQNTATVDDDQGLSQQQLFCDVYGATEAPGISTNYTIRSGLEIAIIKVPGYQNRVTTIRSNDHQKEGDNNNNNNNKLYHRIEGELVVRGSGVSRKYHNDESSSNESFLKDGWYRTGDVVRIETCVVSTTNKNDDDDDDDQRLARQNIIMTEEIEIADGNGTITNIKATKIVKHSSSSSSASTPTKLYVLDRVKDFVELYVDHQSAWVPVAKIEKKLNGITISTSSNNKNDKKEIATTMMITTTVEQIAIFGDRMLPFLVAIVGVDRLPGEQKEQNADDEFEMKLLSAFRNKIKEGDGDVSALTPPDYWIPQKVLVYEIEDSSLPENNSDDDQSEMKNKRLMMMPRWVAGGRFRTHLGKLRRGEVGKYFRDDLAHVLV